MAQIKSEVLQHNAFSLLAGSLFFFVEEHDRPTTHLLDEKTQISE
jgi:hypothetical protein